MFTEHCQEEAGSSHEIRLYNVGNLAPGILHTGYMDLPQPEGIQENFKGPEGIALTIKLAWARSWHPPIAPRSWSAGMMSRGVKQGEFTVKTNPK